MGVETVDGFSGHADHQGLETFVETMNPRPERVLCVHGDESSTDQLSSALYQEFPWGLSHRKTWRRSDLPDRRRGSGERRLWSIGRRPTVRRGQNRSVARDDTSRRQNVLATESRKLTERPDEPSDAMPVGHMGPDDVVTTAPDATVGDVADQLESEKVGSVVVAEDDEPVGIVTDRDIALEINQTDDVASQSVEAVMTEDPATLREDEPGMEISRAIDENNVRRIPVVDENDKLAGIVTLDDLVATIGEELDNVSETIESQSPDYRP